MYTCTYLRRYSIAINRHSKVWLQGVRHIPTELLPVAVRFSRPYLRPSAAETGPDHWVRRCHCRGLRQWSTRQWPSVTWEWTTHHFLGAENVENGTFICWGQLALVYKSTQYIFCLFILYTYAVVVNYLSTDPSSSHPSMYLPSLSVHTTCTNYTHNIYDKNSRMDPGVTTHLHSSFPRSPIIYSSSNNIPATIHIWQVPTINGRACSQHKL